MKLSTQVFVALVATVLFVSALAQDGFVTEHLEDAQPNSARTDRANSLVGKSRAEYVCNQVVNYAIYGVKNNGMLASSYLRWGSPASGPGAGRVVVGKDGAHVGIFVSSSEFVHSSSSKYSVIRVGISQLPYVFPSGYVIRTDGQSLSVETPTETESALVVNNSEPNSARTDRANSLVGKSRAEYVCNQVVNYAIYGVKNNGMLASSYLRWGSPASGPGAGRVVVGKDGAHVGIFVSSSEFVHSSSSKYAVVRVGISQLPYVFPSGYVIRTDGQSLFDEAPAETESALVVNNSEPNSARTDRANSLVGKSRAEYVCNQVVNYAIYGVKNNGMLASSYLRWGSPASGPGAGRVVVGKDGAHVGIFVSSSEFVHSSSSKYSVIRVGLSQLPYVFPSGYVIRTDGQSLQMDLPENVLAAVKNFVHQN